MRFPVVLAIIALATPALADRRPAVVYQARATPAEVKDCLYGFDDSHTGNLPQVAQTPKGWDLYYPNSRRTVRIVGQDAGSRVTVFGMLAKAAMRKAKDACLLNEVG